MFLMRSPGEVESKISYALTVAGEVSGAFEIVAHSSFSREVGQCRTVS